jgi:hypothetical protein
MYNHNNSVSGCIVTIKSNGRLPHLPKDSLIKAIYIESYGLVIVPNQPRRGLFTYWRDRKERFCPQGQEKKFDRAQIDLILEVVRGQEKIEEECQGLAKTI